MTDDEYILNMRQMLGCFRLSLLMLLMFSFIIVQCDLYLCGSPQNSFFWCVLCNSAAIQHPSSSEIFEKHSNVTNLSVPPCADHLDTVIWIKLYRPDRDGESRTQEYFYCFINNITPNLARQNKELTCCF